MFKGRGARNFDYNSKELVINFSMSVFNFFQKSTALANKNVIKSGWLRNIFSGKSLLCEAETESPEEDDGSIKNENFRKKIEHPLSLCLKYMKSEEYKSTYGDDPVWKIYVRNFKGSLPPKTRKTCVFSDGRFATNNPCPICRDEYLLPHYQNLDLLKQFIAPNGRDLIDSKKTNICQKQHLKLKVAMLKAQDYGLLTFSVPHRHYNYDLYRKK